MSKKKNKEIVSKEEFKTPESSLVGGIQYLKSANIMAIGGPEVFFDLPPRPHINLKVDTHANQVSEQHPNFEVSIRLYGEGTRSAPDAENSTPVQLYQFDIAYSGLFAVQNANADMLEDLLLIEAPRQLFPSARHVMLNLIREAGFPVATIQPIDFRALRQKPVHED